jgi:hypothetical protein
LLPLVQDHAKDAEFLNVPIVNYQFMQTIFGSGVTTGRFTMESNKALGHPSKQDTIDLDTDAPAPSKEDGPAHKEKLDDKKLNKRKRGLSEEEVALVTGMIEAVWGMGAAISEGNHSEVALGIYEVVMGCPHFARSDLMLCLNYLMDHKGPAFVFVQMTPSDKDLWSTQHLAKVRGKMAFQ